MHVECIPVFCPETRQTFLTPISFAVYDKTSKKPPIVYVKRFGRYRIAQHARKKAEDTKNEHLKKLFGNDFLQFRDYVYYVGSDKAKTFVRTSESFMDTLYTLVKNDKPKCAQGYLVSQLFGLPITCVERAVLPKNIFKEYQVQDGTPCSKVTFLATNVIGPQKPLETESVQTEE